LNFAYTPRYPVLDTKDFDVFIGQTPYPARVDPKTAFIIRYHDAIPMLMPHTISDKSLHQAQHFYALMSNINSGAWFACVSNATRRDLIRIFPAAAERAVTIYNMISNHYFFESSPFERIHGIIRSRLYGFDPDGKDLGLVPKFLTLREQEAFYDKHLKADHFKYLLIVSTIEPRKNHARLLAAWEVLKAEVDPDIKLVIVGTLGWDYKQIFKAFKTWIDRGQLFMLNAVPAPDLRVLYRHAAATVCPSLGEGFDFSGVESMCSGGITVASDIPVHREVYNDAAEYFDPYATKSLVSILKKVLYNPGALQVQEQLRRRGHEISSQYLPEKILPQWEDFLRRVIADTPVQK
jgi:glycosyltransferase involved in cell wall biosynthesis